jgi:multidrug resistance efflux pump
MRVTRILLLLSVLTVGIPAGMGALKSSQSTATVPLQQQSIVQPTFFQQATQTPPQVSLLGTVEANQTADLTFRLSGTVAEVLVAAGDEVEAGTLLAKLDNSSQQTALDQAKLNLEGAQLNLSDLQKPPDATTIQSAQASLLSAQESYNKTANSVSATDLQSAQIKYQQAQDAYNLAVQQRANMSGTPEQLALQDAAVGQASFNADIAKLQLEKLQTPNSASLWSASARVAIAQLNLQQAMQGATPAQLQNAQLAVESAQLQVTNAQTQLDRTLLIAPIAGVVTAVNVNPGDSASPSLVAIEITDMSKLRLKAPLNELDLSRVSEGAAAAVRLDALSSLDIPATVDQIDWIGASSSGIVQYNIWLTLNSADPRIRLGMTGTGTISTAS